MEHGDARRGCPGGRGGGGGRNGVLQPLRTGLQRLHQLLLLQAHRSGGTQVLHEGRPHASPRCGVRCGRGDHRVSRLLQRSVGNDRGLPGEAVFPVHHIRERPHLLRPCHPYRVHLHHERHGGAAGALLCRHQPLQALHQEDPRLRAPGAVLLQHLAVSRLREVRAPDLRHGVKARPEGGGVPQGQGCRQGAWQEARFRPSLNRRTLPIGSRVPPSRHPPSCR